MDTSNLIGTLEDAGLSPYQAEAYVTLLELGASPATEIAKSSAVPDPRIYDVLRDLADKGYIETYEQGSLHARAHSPADVLADLRSRASRFEAAAEEIEERWHRPDLEEHHVNIVKRFETVLSRTKEVIRAAESQVQIGATPAEFEQLRGPLETAIDNGVNVRLCLFPTDNERPSQPSRDVLAKTCTEARIRTIPSPFLTLVDRSWTGFSPNRGSVNEYGVIVNDRAHAYVFNWYFLTCLWEVNEPIYTDRSPFPPMTFVDIRRCIRELEPRIADGVRPRVSVEGFDTDTGRAVSAEGTITAVDYAGGEHNPAQPTPLSGLSGKASITLETAEGEIEIGGWGAMLEEIEATKIVVNGFE